MCAGIMLFKVRLATESRQTAQAVVTQRFLETHYRYFGGQKTDQSKQRSSGYGSVGNNTYNTTVQLDATASVAGPLDSSWLDGNFPEVAALREIFEDNS
jgi:hypothetical protein